MYSDGDEQGLKFELGVSPILGVNHRFFWGDEFNWTSLLSVAWKNIENPGLAIRPIVSKKKSSNSSPQIYSSASYWSTAIHLLGLGMGWTNIGEGLRIWREADFRKDHHPILDFIWRSYGEDIYSLELYFATQQRWQIFNSLSEMGNRVSSETSQPGPNWRSLDYDWQNVGYLESLKSKSRNLAEQLLEGGIDPLHLERHIVESFIPKKEPDYSDR
jgi:hypothetical protein